MFIFCLLSLIIWIKFLLNKKLNIQVFFSEFAEFFFEDTKIYRKYLGKKKLYNAIDF